MGLGGWERLPNGRVGWVCAIPSPALGHRPGAGRRQGCALPPLGTASRELGLGDGEGDARTREGLEGQL